MINYTVEEIPVEQIDLGIRGRKEYTNIPELADSIKRKGLMHNIVVYKPDGQQPVLIAGGRRLKAIKDILDWKVVPCRVYSKPLTELELKSLELEENLQRENLTFVEDVNLKREIHNLQLAIHGQKIDRSSEGQGHTMEDTAAMLGIDRSTLSLDMKLAKAMEEFPDIQWDRYKNKHEAMKVLNTINTSINRMEKAREVECQLGDNNSKASILSRSYVVGDFFQHIDECPNEYFNLIEIDPPYAIDLTSKKKGYNSPGYDKTGYNEVDADKYEEFMFKVFSKCYQKAAPNAWLICWFGPEPWFQPIYDLSRKAGWRTTRLVALWVKGEEKDEVTKADAGQTHMPQKRLANAYEFFYYMWKGDPILNRPGRSNVFGYKPTPHTSKIHPTERPIDLMSDVLSTFGQPGDRLLVPFAGSGNSLIAGMLNSMTPLGFDLTQGYKDGFLCRVKELLV